MRVVNGGQSWESFGLKVEVKFLRFYPRNRLQIIEEEQTMVRR